MVQITIVSLYVSHNPFALYTQSEAIGGDNNNIEWKEFSMDLSSLWGEALFDSILQLEVHDQTAKKLIGLVQVLSYLLQHSLP